MKDNGVDYVIDYENFDQQIQMSRPAGFDLILDNNSLTDQTSSSRHLRSLGRIVIIGVNNLIRDEHKISAWTLLKAWWRNLPIPMMTLMQKSQSFGGFHLGHLVIEEPKLVRKVFCDIYESVAKGDLKPKIDIVVPLEDVVTATKLLADRKNVGKVLLRTSNVVLNAQECLA